jgi:hypothetical protein
MVGFRQVLWIVMLEFTKDQILGVDTPGQHVTPRVRYRMHFLLIRDAVKSVPCSDEWGSGMVIHSGPHDANGVVIL